MCAQEDGGETSSSTAATARAPSTHQHGASGTPGFPRPYPEIADVAEMFQSSVLLSFLNLIMRKMAFHYQAEVRLIYNLPSISHPLRPASLSLRVPARQTRQGFYNPSNIFLISKASGYDLLIRRCHC